MIKLILLSLLSNLLFACGFRTEDHYLEVPQICEGDPNTVRIYAKEFIPSEQIINQIFVILGGGEYFSHNYAVKIAEVLAGLGIRCIVPDRRGCGKSDPLTKIFPFDRVADDFSNILRQIYGSDKEFVLVGHSNGATYAKIMLKKVERCVGLIVLNGAPSSFDDQEKCKKYVIEGLKNRFWNGELRALSTLLSHKLLPKYKFCTSSFLQASLPVFLSEADRIFFTKLELKDFEPVLSKGDIDFNKRNSFYKHFKTSSNSNSCTEERNYMPKNDNDIRPIPMFIYASDADPVNPLDITYREVEFLRTITTGEVKLTVVEGQGHKPTHPRNVEAFKAWIKWVISEIQVDEDDTDVPQIISL